VREYDRLPKAPRLEETDPAERPQYEAVAERTERIHGLEGQAAKYFGALLNSPPLAAALAELGTQVRRGQVRGTYTDAERELMDIALAAELGCNSILPIHLPDALAVGVRLEAIETLLRGKEGKLLEEEEGLIAYARDFVEGRVTDDSYAAIRKRFGERGAVEFTILLGFLLMTLRLWQALGVPEPTGEEVDSLLDGLRSGNLPLPDPHARIG
jgi:4-carboxymuconolactone decarboxylase